MGCGCGGGRGAVTPAGPRAAEQPVTGQEFEVTYPNGTTAAFATEWQARRAVAVAGGSWRRITAGPGAGT